MRHSKREGKRKAPTPPPALPLAPTVPVEHGSSRSDLIIWACSDIGERW